MRDDDKSRKRKASPMIVGTRRTGPRSCRGAGVKTLCPSMSGSQVYGDAPRGSSVEVQEKAVGAARAIEVYTRSYSDAAVVVDETPCVSDDATIQRLAMAMAVDLAVDMNKAYTDSFTSKKKALQDAQHTLELDKAALVMRKARLGVQRAVMKGHNRRRDAKWNARFRDMSIAYGCKWEAVLAEHDKLKDERKSFETAAGESIGKLICPECNTYTDAHVNPIRYGVDCACGVCHNSVSVLDMCALDCTHCMCKGCAIKIRDDASKDIPSVLTDELIGNLPQFLLDADLTHLCW